MTRKLRPGPLCFMLILSWVLTASAQQLERHYDSNTSLSYGFVSPNTRQDLKLGEALREMNSREEWNLIKRVKNFRCVLKTKIEAARALGSWSDGAENSVLLRVRTDEPSIRYLLARIGRDSNQKSVLYFHPRSDGDASLYIFRVRTLFRLNVLAGVLDRAGIEFRTLVPTGKSTVAYVVDLKRDLRDKVLIVARRLKARVISRTGSAAFIGEQSVSLARIAYEKEIDDYERMHTHLPGLCR